MNTNGNRYKKMAYNYDLISGKVNMVTYQPGYYNAGTQTWIRNIDQFYHRYVYDAENKLTDVYTSHDSLIWERDAQYTYYKHGPMARTVIGQQQVQGIDYAYTLQGWLKGVNSSAVTVAGEESCAPGTARDTLDVYSRAQYGQPSTYTARKEINFNPEFDHTAGDDFETVINGSLAPCVPVIAPTPYANGDMGEDGKMDLVHHLMTRDAFGFALNYYEYTGTNGLVKDYQSINAGYQPFADGMFNLANFGAEAIVAKPLFNGNIASMFVNIPKVGTPQLYGYQYDQLNRIVGMDAFDGFNNNGNSWTNGTPTARKNYKEQVSYDANGNILTYLRNGEASRLAMDKLTYQYPKDANGKILNNRLRYVHDQESATLYTEDIDSQTPLTLAQVQAERLPEQAGDNYTYDAIGNLIKDTKEGITNITWTVYGKIASITKNGKTIYYTYDASGNRLSKTVPNDIPAGTVNTTWYTRDATGNVMSVYEQRWDLNNAHLTQTEVNLYGSSRLGIYNVNRDMTATPPPGFAIFERGKKMYELSNHLGNVLATVSDRKLPVDDGTYQPQCYPCFPGIVCPPCVYYKVSSTPDGIVDYYNADVITANDYYPFGMGMVGRKYTNGKESRYGFNGKERDKDIAVDNYDFGARIYDGRIGRWLSSDPKERKYAYLSPYNFAYNNPVQFVDRDGEDGMITGTGTQNDPFIITASYHYVGGTVNEAQLKGLNQAMADYNNKGNAFAINDGNGGTVHVRFNLTVQEIPAGQNFRDNIRFNEANVFTDINGRRRTSANLLANEDVAGFDAANFDVTTVNQDLGFAYHDQIGFHGNTTDAFVTGVDNYLAETNSAENRSWGKDKFYKAVMIHEIFHNLGGEHTDRDPDAKDKNNVNEMKIVGSSFQHNGVSSNGKIREANFDLSEVSKKGILTLIQHRDRPTLDANRARQAVLFTRRVEPPAPAPAPAQPNQPAQPPAPNQN
jgi:RHS repeat-associated protein